MADFQKILVAVAFPHYAEGILRYAADLATKLDARLVIASIINARDVAAVRQVADMGYDVDGEHYVSSIKAERTQIAESLINSCGIAKDRFRIVIRVGNPVDELLKIIVAEQVGLVVMGLKGRSEMEHVLVGSVAEKIFHNSPVTVISYRDEALADRLRRRIKV